MSTLLEGLRRPRPGAARWARSSRASLVASAADDPRPATRPIIDPGTPSDPTPTGPSRTSDAPARPATTERGDDAERRRRRRATTTPTTTTSTRTTDDDDGDDGDDHAGRPAATTIDDDRRRAVGGDDSGPAATGSGRRWRRSGSGDGSGDDSSGTVATTTEPQHPSGARPERSGVSVRARITAAVALLVALALAGAGADRLRHRVASGSTSEIARRGSTRSSPSSRSFQDDGVDPETGSRSPTVGELLDAFLEPQRPRRRRDCWSAGCDGAAAAGLVRTGDDRRRTTRPSRRPPRPSWTPTAPTRDRRPPTDELLVNAQPVQQGGETGALVVVTFLDDARAGLHDTMRTYAIVALLSLLADHRASPPGSPAACSRRCGRCARPPRRSARPTCPGGSPRPATTTSPR